MKQIGLTICGLTCNVLHKFSVQLGVNFDPERLGEELRRRATSSRHKDAYKARYSLIKRAEGVNVYAIVTAHEDAIPIILDILEEIEAEVGRELERRHLLDLLAQSDADMTYKPF